MSNALNLWEIPTANEIYMLAGWRQWADAGSISSGLPEYLVEHMDARPIGEIATSDFYLFQMPGTQSLLRPVIKLQEGYRESLERPSNEIYYAGNDDKGLVIFLGDEPHMNVDGYADAFFEIAKRMGVKRVVALGGVFGSMPYDRDREVSSVYSLQHMKQELDEYAVNFSNYEGGATIGAYLLDQAEHEQIEFMTFYGFVPYYHFGEMDPNAPQGIRIEYDFKAWYDIMRRINHMFGMNIDLSELERQAGELTEAIDAQIDELARELPEVDIRRYMEAVESDFTERTFLPLDDLWVEELGDLFDDEPSG